MANGVVPFSDGPPQLDLQSAFLFIEALAGSTAAAVTFQTFDDKEERKEPRLARVLHGTLVEHARELERLNGEGAGVFAMVNEGDGMVHLGERTCRTTANVVALRALFADFDAGPPLRYALAPSYTVVSRRGPQPYWLLNAGVPLRCFSPAQQQLAAFYQSDPSVKDLPRVMRVPGFLHRKETPFLVTFFAGTLTRYQLDEVLAAHQVNEIRKRPRPVPTPEQTCGKIPVGRRREAWKALAAQLHNDGVPLGAKVRLMMVFAREMFESPETAREEDAVGLASWYEGRDQATDFRREMAVPAVAPKVVEAAAPWPVFPIAPSRGNKALYGLAGEVVRAIDPYIEADPVAILAHYLVFFGNCVGPAPHFWVSGSRHTAKLFAALVGDSATGRKGTAEGQIRYLFEGVDVAWTRRFIQGLASGEGLVRAFEPLDATGNPEEPRQVVLESEMVNILKAMSREGSTLSGTLRKAWDQEGLSIQRSSSKNTIRVSSTHVSIVTHITPGELLRSMDRNQSSNGFANRFLWFLVKRSKSLPHAPQVPKAVLDALVKETTAAVSFGSETREMARDERASRLWEGIYEPLARGSSGLVGAVTTRGHAQVLRLSMIYALLDLSRLVRVEHLEAAKALWDFTVDSARYVFGDRYGDPLANRILEVLRSTADLRLARAELNKELGGHFNGKDILAALSLLLEDGQIRIFRGASRGGRAPEWIEIPEGKR